MKLKLIVPAALVLACASAVAADMRVEMKMATEKGAGASAGHVTVSETQYGIVLTPHLAGLPAGVHGFHVHENPSCDPKEKDGKMTPAQAAGAHYDPSGSKRHGTPWGDGHLGDLPALYVGADGKANNPVLAPRLKIADFKGRALMVHAGGDNHSDHPAPLGGGAGRIACGVVN